MSKLTSDQKGFSAIEAVLVLVIVALICAVGYLAYKDRHKTTPVNTASKTTNIYAGWKTFTLADEKLTFQYPPAWKLENYTNTGTGNQDYKADWVDLTASDGFDLDINDGLNGTGDPVPLISTDPVKVTYVDQTAYMVFAHPGNLGVPGESVNYNLVSGFFILLTNPNDQTTVPKNRNVTLSDAEYTPTSQNLSSDSTPGIMFITGGYGAKSVTFNSVEQAMQDIDFKDAKLVIESMHY